MDWKAKALALVVRAKNAVVYYFNLVIDPPPAAIKWYILATLIVAIGGGIIGAKLSPADKPTAAPVYLMPRMPSVVTTTLPPPSASPKDLAPLELIKAKDAPKKRKVVKRKAPKVTSARDDMRF